jgi:hypothetical protein
MTHVQQTPLVRQYNVEHIDEQVMECFHNHYRYFTLVCNIFNSTYFSPNYLNGKIF